jgi:hypothetical protein
LEPAFGRAPFGLAMCHAATGERARVAHSMVSAWGLGAGGGTRQEVADLPPVTSDPEGTLRALRDLVGPRAGTVPTHRLAEIMLNVILDDRERVLDSMREARTEGSLGFVLTYAAALDPLRSDDRFTTLMDDAGLLLPRWR